MRRWLIRAGLALLALVAVAIAALMLLWQKRPSLEPYQSLTLPAAPEGSPIRVRFAGVATLVFDDGDTAWMTDGFFSRPGVSKVFFSKIRPDEDAINRELKHLNITRLAAVVPVHSHYDHAMDSPLVAQRTGALLVGSASTINIGRGLGTAEDRMSVVTAGSVVEFGAWKLTFIPSRHSPTPFSDGKTSETVLTPLVTPARATAWKEGTVWSILAEHNSGRTILVQGSAGFEPGALAGRHADTVFLGVGTLGKKTPEYRSQYWNEVVKQVGARRVIPIHWDDFFLPLDEPLVPMSILADDFSATMADLARFAQRDGVELRMAPAFTPFTPFKP
ncbi:MBL fold metallo-hydrolase [Piscinibacter terrae]|uniref:MBL fold metallo-hydrolase n=1 Tax=Piscinibacter terrae TaxID=2496871 RepID=A0A3N7HV44_9BURK|nr:MBL fold metallo-hydrolase [Albitalea terrae]RQP26220.1 MBL fold metallo-hydrolase [Albitalea terrae]